MDLIQLLRESRDYIVSEMIADEISGRRQSTDKARANLVVRIDEALRDINKMANDDSGAYY